MAGQSPPRMHCSPSAAPLRCSGGHNPDQGVGYAQTCARNGSTFDRGAEAIAAPRHGLDHLWMRRIMFQLEPQSLDEDSQIMPFVTVGRPPDTVKQRAIVHHFVLVPGELG